MEGKIFLEMALEQMPNVFSSNEFSKKANGLGYPIELIRNGNLAVFLHKYCVQLQTKRMWRKKEAVVKKPAVKSSGYVDEFFKVKEAIKLLKSLGYKLSKQVTEWQEI